MKKILFWIALLFIPIIMAIKPIPDTFQNVYYHWPFDVNKSESIHGLDFTGGTNTIGDYNCPVSNGCIRSVGGAQMSTVAENAICDDFTITMWMNNTASTNGVIEKYDGSAGQIIANLESLPNAGWYIYHFLESGSTTKTGYNFYDGDYANGVWKHYAIVVNQSSITVYKDGAEYETHTYGAGYGGGCFNYQWEMILSSSGTTIDDLAMWNKSLTASQVFQIYRGEYASAPIFSDPTPPNASRNNTQVTINITCDTGYSSLYFNNTLVIDNQTSPADYTTSVGEDGQYNYTAFCDEPAINSTRVWYYDATDPTATINPSNFFASDNSSSLSRVQINKSLNISLADNLLLFGFELNITSAGVTQYYNSSESLTGTSYTINDYVNFTDWDLGEYNVSVLVSDAHTLVSVQDYDVKKSLSKLDFTTDEGNHITVKADSISTVDAIKKDDRYNFMFNFGIGKSTKVFTVKSDNPIRYLPNSEYNAHFVVWNKETKQGNWIDFEGYGKPIVSKVSDYEYTVSFSNLEGTVVFNSIGGLNVVEENYKFNLSNVYPVNPKIYLNSFLIWDYIGEFNAQESVNMTGLINNILREGCNCTGCIKSASVCRIPTIFYSDSLSRENVYISTGNYFTNLTVNIYDRETSALITNTVNLNVLEFSNYTTTTGIVNVNNLTASIDTWTLIASSEGYTTNLKTVIFTDWASTNIDMYLTNSTSEDIGNLIVQVFDEFYNLIQGANTKLLEFDIDTNSFIEVSQCYTNTNGECIFNVELNTKFYIVQASKVIDGVAYTVQSTDNGELVKLDNTVIELHLRTSPEYIAPDYYDLVITPYNTSLVGNTSYLTAQFNDGSNIQHQVCIGYYVLSGLSENRVTETCINGSSGIVNYAGGYTLNREYNYRAKIYTRDNEIELLYYSYNYEKLVGSWQNEWSFYLKPFIFFLLLVLLATSLYLKNINIFGVGAIILSLFIPVIYPNLIAGLSVTVIIVIIICLMYMSKRRTEGIT